MIENNNIKADIQKLEEDMIFRNYKHLFNYLGWQNMNEHLSGHKRKVFLDMLSQFARVEKIKDHSDMIIVREIYKK